MPPKRKTRRSLGSVYYDDSNDTWVGAVTLGYKADGTRKRAKIRAKTKREAEEQLATLLSEKSKGTLVEPHHITIEEYVTQYLAQKAKTLRPSSHVENMRLAHIMFQHIGTKKLQELKPPHVKTVLDSTENYSHRTRKKILQMLRSVLDEAVSLELIQRNPATAIKLPREQTEKHGQAWTPEQVTAFLQAAAGKRLYTVYYLLIALGLRIGEALALKLSDLNFDTLTLSIQRTLSGTHDGSISLPKTAAGVRTLYLAPDVVSTLQNWLEYRHSEAQREAYTQNDWLIPSTHGTLLNYNNVRRDYSELCKKAGLPPIRLHDLRHTHITLALKAGINPEVLAGSVGHANSNMTRNVYRHILEEEKQKSALGLTGLLGK